MGKKPKILSIQYLRGLAALGVVLCHYSFALPIYPPLKSAFIFGQAGVHVFFLVSGFIIVHSLIQADYKSNKFFTFLLKRSIRIDPSYYVTLILSLLLFKYLAIISPVNTNSFQFTPLQFLAHLFYIVPFTKYPFYIHVFWTLCVEFQFYILIGSVYFISKNQLFKILFLIAFSLSSFINLPNNDYLVFSYAAIFSAGIALVAVYKNRTWQNFLLLSVFLLMAAIKFGLPVLVLLSAASSIVLLLHYTIKPLAFLGNISYSLYLTHTLLYVLLYRTSVKLNINLNLYAGSWLVAEIVLAIVTAYIFYTVIEKPSIALSKKIFYKKTVPIEI